MKRMMMVLVAVLILSAGTVFAGIDEAIQLYRDKKFVEAEAEFRKVLPGLEGDRVVSAQMHIGYALRAQNKQSEARAEFGKVKAIAGATPYQIANAEYNVGVSLNRVKRYDEAIAKFGEVINMAEAGLSIKESAMLHIGDTLTAQKKYDEVLKQFNVSLYALPSNQVAAQYHTANTLKIQGKTSEAEMEYKKVLVWKEAGTGMISAAVSNIKNIDDMASAFILHLSVQPKVDATGEMSAVRRALLKKAQENSAVCRTIVKAIPADLVVLAELKPFLNLHELSVKEQAEIHKSIWMANLSRVVEDEQARAVVDGSVTALSQLLNLGDKPSIIEVERILSEMK
jgi:tetratricopeptide (TPR) repeat protein